MDVQSDAFPVHPIWDQMMAERNGREPHQFVGHEEWDSSEEAQAAFERGYDSANLTAEAFFGGVPGERFRSPSREFPSVVEFSVNVSKDVDKALEEFRASKRVAARARNRRRKS